MSDQALGVAGAPGPARLERARAGPSLGDLAPSPTPPGAPILTRLPTGAGAAETSGRTWRRVPRGVERLVGVVLLIALWETASRVGWLRSDILAGPSTVVTAGADLWRQGTLPASLVASLTRVAWGLGIGIPVGTVLALVSGSSRAGDDLIDANVQMLRFVPIIALQPLLIVWFGVGETVKITMIVIGVAFPIYVNTSTAIKTLDPRYRELGDVVGLKRRQLVRRVVLPAALPGFLVGLRLAVAIAWLLLVFAETINATSGIGFMMARAQVFFQTDVIVVGLATYAILGLLADGAVRFLERRLLQWQPGR